MQPWEQLEERVIRAGYRTLVERTYRLPDGSVGRFEIKREGPVVAVLAVTAEMRVILARQFRPGPEVVLWELPGGAVDAGETPEAASARELREETGYAGELRALGRYYHCAYSTRIVHTFVATNCHRVSAPELDAHEFIEAVELPLDQFKQHLAAGDLTDTTTAYRGLQFLGLM